MTRLNERRSGAAFSDTPAEDVSARSAAESASGKGDAGISNPDRTDYQPETPASAHDQAMTAVPGPLSPESAVIARKIPRIEPLLRMIEEAGFEVVGLEAAPLTAKPVRIVHTSVGSMVFYQILKRRGYTVALSDTIEEAAEDRPGSEDAERKAVSV